MDVLGRVMVSLVLLGIASPVIAAQLQLPTVFCGTTQWEPIVMQATDRFQIPADWIRAVIRVESAGCTKLDGQPITSSAGAMGLMQLMPPTWNTYRLRLKLGDDPHDPHDNILAGVAYLRDLYDRYGYPGLFAAYQAGPGRFDEYLTGGRPLPPETIEYLARVQQHSQAIGATRSVFVNRNAISPYAKPSSDPLATRSLFVQLSSRTSITNKATSEHADVQAQ